jgi:hypothetical protein
VAKRHILSDWRSPSESKHGPRERPVTPQFEWPVYVREFGAYPDEGEGAQSVEHPACHPEVVDERREAGGGEDENEARPDALREVEKAIRI